MGRIQSAEMIAEAGIPVHLIETWVAWHDEAIGLVKEAKSSAEVDPIIQAELHADILIQGKVLVRGVPGERLLGVSRHACLDAIKGLDACVVEPDHPSAYGQDADTGDGFIGLREPVAKNIGFAGLAEDDDWEKLPGKIHVSADDPAPRMSVIFDGPEVEVAIPVIGEEVNVAKRVQAFEDDLGFHWTARCRLGR